jgi:hypothetical protein
MTDAQVFKILLFHNNAIFFKGMYYTFHLSISDWDYFYAEEVPRKLIFLEQNRKEENLLII